MRLDEVLKFYSTPNVSRIDFDYEKNLLYSINDLENDLYQLNKTDKVIQKKSIKQDYFTHKGDFIISLIKEKATIVSSSNEGKLLSSSFLKCSVDSTKADPWFLAFVLNETVLIKKMKHKRTGVQGLKFLHLSINEIKNMEINFPSLNEQKKIGDAYRLYLKHFALIQQKNEILKKTLNSIFEYYMKGEN